MSNINKGTSAGVFLTNPDNSYTPYTASNPQPAGVGGFTDIADNSTFKRALIDSNGHLQVDIVSGGGGGGGDATAANQTTMISHLSDIDTAVTGTLAVSAAALPLPSGAATSAAQSSGNASLATLAGAVSGSEVQVDIVSAPNLSVTDSVGNASLATLAGAVVGSEVQVDIVSAPTLNVADSTAQASLATLAGAVVGSELQVDIVSSATVPVSAASLPLPAGAATSAAQSSGNASLATIASDSTSIDGKISQGSDVTLTNAQQVLCYGRDTGGSLDALRTDAQGHLEVVVDDFVKGQDVMANSLPVVIASDQSTLNVSDSTAQSSLATIAACENGANALQVDIQADAIGLASQLKQDNIITQLKSDFHTNNVMNAQAIGSGANATSSVHDFGADKIPRDFTGVLIQITDSAAGGGQLQIEGSLDNSTFHNLGYSTSFPGSGLFPLQEFLSYVALPRYVRFRVENLGFASSNFSVDVGYYRS